VELTLNPERPGKNLGHYGIVDVTRGQRSCLLLIGRGQVHRRQPAIGKEGRPGSIRSRIGAEVRTPTRRRGQAARRCWIHFALDLRGQRDGSEVLELPSIGNAKSSSQGCLSVSPRVVSKTNPGGKVVAIGFRLAEGNDVGNTRDGVLCLGLTPDRIRPVLVAESEVQCQARSQLQVVLEVSCEQTLGSEEAATARASQGTSRHRSQVVVHEVLGCLVPIVAVAAWQEE